MRMRPSHMGRMAARMIFVSSDLFTLNIKSSVSLGGEYSESLPTSVPGIQSNKI